MTNYTPEFWWHVPLLLRRILFPLYVLTCLVNFLLCTFDLHQWYHVEREDWSGYGGLPYHEEYDVCHRCRVIKLGTWKREIMRDYYA